MSDAVSHTRRPFVPRPGAEAQAVARPRADDQAVEAAPQVVPTAENSDRDPPLPPPLEMPPRRDGKPDAVVEEAENGSGRHPLVYLVVDTVTGKLVWKAEGDPVDLDAAHRQGTYGPNAQLVERDAEAGYHTVSKRV